MLVYQGLLLLCLGGYAMSQTGTATVATSTVAAAATGGGGGSQTSAAAGNTQTPTPSNKAPVNPPTAPGAATGSTKSTDQDWVTSMQTVTNIVANCTASSTNNVNPCATETTALSAATSKSGRCSAWDDMKMCVKDNCKYTFDDSIEKLDAYCGSCTMKATFALIGVLASLAMFFKF